jgi:phenylacetate-CoA ligase
VFWPRTGFQEFEAGIVHELLYRNSFQIDKHKTLLIIGFPMGIYVSGVATLLPSFLISTKGYNLTVASVGTNKDDILRIASLLKENYEQVVLIGHPLFIKDVIETGKEKGIKWPERRTKLMFCSEGFSEKFRDYIMSRAGIKLKANVISTYGTSEMLLVAYETPASIELRELADKNLKIRNKIFGSETVPNLFQYNPLLRYIETVNNELVFTSASGIPLIRYNLHDSGRIISSRLVRKLLNHKIDWQLPFLTLHGRSDYTVIFYAANIYPEHIRASLDHSSLLKKLTGKFTMRKGYYKNMDEYLEINFELKDGEMPNKKFTLEIQKRIVAGLRKLNLEYLFLCNNLGKNLTPIIKLWSYRHEKYFQPGLKPRYITK